MHIGKETLAKNRDRLRSYTYSPDMDSDCFIHLLMTGWFISTSHPLALKQETPVAISELHYPFAPDVRQP